VKSGHGLEDTPIHIYVYVFRKYPSFIGFTSDEAGSNLPRDLRPWHLKEVLGIVVVSQPVGDIPQTAEREDFSLVNNILR
jgi:hypothetical protein